MFIAFHSNQSSGVTMRKILPQIDADENLDDLKQCINEDMELEQQYKISARIDRCHYRKLLDMTYVQNIKVLGAAYGTPDWNETTTANYYRTARMHIWHVRNFRAEKHYGLAKENIQ